MRSASTEVGGTVNKAECSSSKQGGLSSVFVKSLTILLQRSELGVGAAIFSAVMNSWKAAVGEAQGISRFLAQGGGGGILKSRRGIPIFYK